MYFVGSILVTFKVTGTSTLLNSTVSSLCTAVENGTDFNFRGTTLRLSNYLSVNGENYYGSRCAFEVMKTKHCTDQCMQCFKKPLGVIMWIQLPGMILMCVHYV